MKRLKHLICSILMLAASPAMADADIVPPTAPPIPATVPQIDANLLNIQERLAVLGYLPTYMVDGLPKSEMTQAIAQFQKDYGLKPDGVFGVETATALNYYTGTQHIMPIPHYRTVPFQPMTGHYAGW